MLLAISCQALKTAADAGMPMGSMTSYMSHWAASLATRVGGASASHALQIHGTTIDDHRCCRKALSRVVVSLGRALPRCWRSASAWSAERLIRASSNRSGSAEAIRHAAQPHWPRQFRGSDGEQLGGQQMNQDTSAPLPHMQGWRRSSGGRQCSHSCNATQHVDAPMWLRCWHVQKRRS